MLLRGVGLWPVGLSVYHFVLEAPACVRSAGGACDSSMRAGRVQLFLIASFSRSVTWLVSSPGRVDGDLKLGEAPLQQPVLGLAGGREVERCQVGTLCLVGAAEAAQEVRTSRWQQVVAGQGCHIQSVQLR